MTAQSIIFIFGGLLIVIGVLGGGFEIKELKVPKIAGINRALSLIGGILLVGIGITVLNQSNPFSPAPLPKPISTLEPNRQVLPPRIKIVAGSYGKNCGAPYGNKTAHLESQCSGRGSCAYIIDFEIIGDPVPGCMKDYVAEWKCGDDQTIQSAAANAEAGYRSKLQLSCN